MKRPRTRALLLLATAIAIASCTRSPGSGATRANTAARQAERYEVKETIFDAGLKGGWTDGGFAKRDVVDGKPASVDFSGDGAWVLAGRPLEAQQYGALVFRVKVPPGEAEFLEVRLDSTEQTIFPRIKVTAEQRLDVGDDWAEVLVPTSLLDPDGAKFDRVVFRAFRPIPAARILIDRIALTVPAAGAPAASGSSAPLPASNAKPVAIVVDCKAKPTRISPLVYGMGGQGEKTKDPFIAGASSRRWGGNPTSRYNHEIGAWNTGNDWFFENVEAPSFTDWMAAAKEHGTPVAITLPMLGWVSKDKSSVGFPVSQVGQQAGTDAQWRPEAGNGETPDKKPIPSGPPDRTSIAAPPEWVARWVAEIRKTEGEPTADHPRIYILDNEPALWNSTHRDVHPDPLSYDELLARTIAYGSAVRDADPNALIAGPAAWGWPEYFFSAKDAAAGFSSRPDRSAHGNTPLLVWYLQKLKDLEQKTGKRLLDVLDVHFYPQGDQVYQGSGGGTDPKTAALRIRSTRALWDPHYSDESWIHEPIFLLPRMKAWVDENYPGRGIQIGEWNFGAEQHMSGGLATAEALGRFGQFGVTAAYYWTIPPEGSPSYWAFRAYRNFDGKGGRFLDWSLPTAAPPEASAFASRDEAGRHIVAVVLNFSPMEAVRARVDVASCGAIKGGSAYVYKGDRTGFVRADVQGDRAHGLLAEDAPPYSIMVLDLELANPLAAP